MNKPATSRADGAPWPFPNKLAPGSSATITIPRAAPAQKRPARVEVDVATLAIEDVEPPGKRVQVNKYAAVFRALKIGQAVRCKTPETATIANALRDWIRQEKIEARVRAVPRDTDRRTGKIVGRVYLLPLETK